MRDSQKTRNQLLNELQEARRQLEVLAAAEVERKQAGDELSKSEEKFYKAFLSSPDMIIISSIATGKYLEVNESFAEITGYSREELIGHTVEDCNLFVNPEEQQRMIRILDEHGSFRNEEFVFRVRSGEIRHWLCSAQIISIDGDACMIAVAVDVTESKKMEQALRESEEKFSKAFSFSPVAIAITTLKEGKFVAVNETQSRFSGYKPAEFIGRTAQEMGLWGKPDDREKILRLLTERGRIYNEEIVFRSRSGSLLTTLFSAEVINISGEECMISSSLDVTDRKKMEQALRESEEKFSQAFNLSPIAVGLIDIDASRFVEVNDSFLRFTGYSREEVIGRTPEELELWVNPADSGLMDANLRKTGGLFNAEIKSRMKSGDIRTGLFSAQTITIGSQCRLILVITDITAEVTAKEALRESENRFSMAFHTSPVAIAITKLKDGIYVDVNENYIVSTGYSRKELIGHTTRSVNIWASLEDRARMMAIVQKQGRVQNAEFDFRIKSGEIRTWLISFEPITTGGEPCLIGVSVDITERKRAEQALRQSEEKFSKAFHAGPLAISVNKFADGCFVEVNESFTAIFGFTREEAIGKTSLELNIWLDRQDREHFVQILRQEGRIRNQEYVFRNKSGGTRNYLLSAEMIEYEGEICVLVVTNDITDYKRMRAQVLEAENLKEVDRLRSELLANVSHELRTPLASIKGFATMLLDYGNRLKSPEKRGYLETIDKNTDRLVELIEQLIEMSRMGAGMLSIRKTSVNVSQLCKSALSQARKESPGYSFVQDITPRLPRVNADVQRIRQVLDNVLDNAVKYSRPGVEITLSVRRSGEEMLFTVADCGIGIPKDDLPHIFERIFNAPRRQKSAVPGAGLGLPMCKALITAHGGRIWIESEEGVGTRCFFTLPLNAEATPDSAAWDLPD
ncbi:MAG: PAS domain S-box protein [Dehalococcoidales bacterium]|jgi:PAS domain S-box-containing protein